MTFWVQGMTLWIVRTCPPDIQHEICTCPDGLLTCPPPQNVYIIHNSISICQKMNLSTGQVADKIYLSGWKFYLSWTTGQPLMSLPGYIHHIHTRYALGYEQEPYSLWMTYWPWPLYSRSWTWPSRSQHLVSTITPEWFELHSPYLPRLCIMIGTRTLFIIWINWDFVFMGFFMHCMYTIILPSERVKRSVGVGGCL